VEELEKFAGHYGPRHIFLRDGRLYYKRDFRKEYLLVPIKSKTFSLEGYPLFRIRFVPDEEGNITKIVGLYITGRTDETPNTK
jgi:hypothetical protein